jgi:hypothetical protein
MKEVTDPGKKGHKKKTKHNDVHKDRLPLVWGKMFQLWYKWRVCPFPSGIVKRGEFAGERGPLECGWLETFTNSIT